MLVDTSTFLPSTVGLSMAFIVSTMMFHILVFIDTSFRSTCVLSAVAEMLLPMEIPRATVLIATNNHM